MSAGLSESAPAPLPRPFEKPAGEPSRLAALHQYEILDTEPEPAFDDVVRLAAQICGTPMALVSFVDEDRQWFKSRIGVHAAQTPRDISFCTHTILRHDDLLLVPDATADPRFADSPLVTSEPRIRFYAGAPLITADGHALGALCVKDTIARELDEAQRQALLALSRQVMRLLELRRSIQEREQLHARLELVLETIPTAIVMARDADDQIVLVNAAAQALFGYTREELLSLPLERLVPERLLGRWAEHRQALRERGEARVSGLEARALRKDGTQRPTELSLARLTVAQTAFVLLSITDVSHRKHIEARLSEVQTLQRAIVDHAGCAIFSTASDGLITSFNPAAQRMFGYHADEVVGVRQADFLHEPVELAAEDGPVPPGWIPVPGFEVNVRADGTPRECEWTCVRKDGSRLPVLLSVTALRNPAGRPNGFLGLAIDISERKRAEDLLRAKNEDLKTFAYTVSHDLKAPLRGILGYAQELQRRHREGLAERAVFCLEQIVTASRSLDQLIEDLLHYSRCLAEKPQFEDVAVADLVHRILQERGPTLREQGVVLDLRVPSLVVRTWDRGLHQVLGNLVDNALKYSRQAKPPRMAIEAVAIAGQCQIRIQDNGIGFDMKYHDRIFGLFNRLVRASDFEGTGAGLAIVAKLVAKLHGRVHAVSAPGQGATFIVELPEIPLEPEALACR